MAHSIRDIATALAAEAEGDLDLVISRACEPSAAGAGDLALAMDPRYGDGIAKGKAQAALLWPGADWRALGLKAAIFAPRGRLAMAGLTVLLDEGPDIAPGLHPMAVIDPTAEIGAGAAIGPFVTIGAGVRIGARVTIGARFFAQPGAVVGGDGFSFVTPEVSDIEQVRATLGAERAARAQSYARIHSLGSVQIGDDVELGANACIDRGTVRDTKIGNGVKFDNLAQIGHNVEIGNDCLICAQVGVAGSTRIGNNVVLGGQTGVSDNLLIGDHVITGGATKVLANVPAGRVMLGYPAMQMQTHIESYKGIRRLPRLFRDVAALQKAVFKPGSSD